jgi:hypothetical protein
MDENISIKYAVYIDKDGDDVLEVVRDTVEQAKSDMEGLKNKTSRVRIKKTNIKNFGKDDEKVIDSETVTSWDSADGKSGSGVDSGIQSNQSVTPPVVTAPPIVPTPPVVAPVITEPKVETWQEYYGRKGALIWGEGFEELTKAKEIKVEAKIEGDTSATPIATPTPASSTTTPSTSIPSNEIKTDAIPPAVAPQNIGNNSGIAPVISDSDVDRIAEKLKEKLSQNGVQSTVKPDPIKA